MATTKKTTTRRPARSRTTAPRATSSAKRSLATRTGKAISDRPVATAAIATRRCPAKCVPPACCRTGETRAACRPHLGSVDWSYDTPNRHYITIYRVLVTARGAAAGQTLNGLLARVLALSGIDAPQQLPALATPLHRDPFRAAVQRTVLLPN